jgi:lipopolysaccharide export system permease protein
MGIFDRYIFKNLLTASLFIAGTLAVVIFLTQSLRFLELVIQSGASGGTFWLLTFLAMPRFFEIIVPLSLMAGTLFIYNRMANDSELIAIRSVGHDPGTLARPAVILAFAATIFLLANTLWIAPSAISSMQHMRQMVKAQFSTALFREGIFNQMGQGLTVYIRERDREGILHGLMIHDSRDEDLLPSTVVAKTGTLVSADDGYQILLNEGSRQEYDPEKGTLKRLNFDRYTIELPESESVVQRWQEPDERTLYDLLNPDMKIARDVENLREFKIELNRRLISPVFAVVFTLVSCAFLLVGPLDRRGQTRRIATAVGIVVVIQGLYIASYNLARQSDVGIVLMWFLVFAPLFISIFFLTGFSEKIRRRLFYRSAEEVAAP